MAALQNNTPYIENIKSVYRTGNLIGLIPPINDSKLKAYKIYCIVLIILFLIIWLESIYLRLNDIFEENIIHLILAGGQQTVANIAIVIDIYTTGFLNVEKFYLLNYLFNKLDYGLIGRDIIWKHGKLYVILKCLIFVIIVVIIICYIQFLLLSDNIISIAILTGNLHHYTYTLVSVLLIYNFVSLINMRLEFVNKLLASLYEKYKFISIINVNVINPVLIRAASNEVTRIRNLLSLSLEICSITNTFLDYKLLLLMVTIFIETLNIIHIVLMTLGSLKIGSLIFSKLIRIYVISATTIILFYIMGIMVVIICDETTKEVEKITTTCYNFISKIHAKSNFSQDAILRKELVLLANRSMHQCPHFTVIGLFNVNRTIFISFLGTIIPYIILLAQINIPKTT